MDEERRINAALESRAPFFKVMHFVLPLPREGEREREKEVLDRGASLFCIAYHPHRYSSTSIRAPPSLPPNSKSDRNLSAPNSNDDRNDAGVVGVTP